MRKQALLGLSGILLALAALAPAPAAPADEIKLVGVITAIDIAGPGPEADTVERMKNRLLVVRQC